MTKHVYEISVQGPVPAELLAELGAGTPVLAPTETVLITGTLDQDELRTLVARIADLGLDVRELRRVPRPGGVASTHPAADDEAADHTAGTP